MIFTYFTSNFAIFRHLLSFGCIFSKFLSHSKFLPKGCPSLDSTQFAFHPAMIVLNCILLFDRFQSNRRLLLPPPSVNRVFVAQFVPAKDVQVKNMVCFWSWLSPVLFFQNTHMRVGGWVGVCVCLFKLFFVVNFWLSLQKPLEFWLEIWVKSFFGLHFKVMEFLCQSRFFFLV